MYDKAVIYPARSEGGLATFSSTVPRRVFAIAVLFCIALFLIHQTARAGDGDLDPTFDGDGKVTTEFFGPGNTSYAVAIQPDGKIVAAGAIYPLPSGQSESFNASDIGVARYNPDGSLDASFGDAGKVTTDFVLYSDYAYALAVQPDGKIIIAGAAGTPDTNFDIALARYNPDGSLDATFGSGGKVTTSIHPADDIAYAMVLQPDGKIVVAGRGVKDFDMTGTDWVLVRYNSNGSPDLSFGDGGRVFTNFGAEEIAYALALQTDGKIVAGGAINLRFEGSDFGLARYNADGSLDTTFGVEGRIRDNNGGDGVREIAVQPDGRIIAAGSLQIVAANYNFLLLRYNANGSPDPLFGTAGRVATDFNGTIDILTSMVLQPDGKIVAAGYAEDAERTDGDFALTRYNSDGSLDAAFGNGGKVTTPILNDGEAVFALTSQPDGKIVAAGYSNLDTLTLGDDVFALARFGGPVTRERCTAPGVAVVNDLPGDQVGAPANAQLDIRAISFAEPYFEDGSERLVITMKVSDLALRPPNSEWDVAFTVPAGTRHFVRMTTRGSMMYQYGHITPGGARISEGAADSGTFAPDGTITITISNNKVGSPPADQSLTGIGGQVTSYISAGTETIPLVGDMAGGSGGYRLIGNYFCRPQTPPTAQLFASPTSGIVPIEVTFDGSASTDPDAGDTLVSYTFAFGDGSPTITQSTPIIAHTYTRAAFTSPRLTVTDSRGAVSANVASVTLFFSAAPFPIAGVASRKTHGTAGPFDVNLPLILPYGIESRTGQPGNGNHTIVFTFVNTLTSVSGASVTGGTGSVSSSTIDPADAHRYIINLSGVTNAQITTVALANVNDSAGNTRDSLQVSMGVLLGDTTADGVVNSADVTQTRRQSGQITGPTNFRTDASVDGAVNSADVTLVRRASGSALPEEEDITP